MLWISSRHVCCSLDKLWERGNLVGNIGEVLLSPFFLSNYTYKQKILLKISQLIKLPKQFHLLQSKPLRPSSTTTCHGPCHSQPLPYHPQRPLPLTPFLFPSPPLTFVATPPTCHPIVIQLPSLPSHILASPSESPLKLQGRSWDFGGP